VLGPVKGGGPLVFGRIRSGEARERPSSGTTGGGKEGKGTRSHKKRAHWGGKPTFTAEEMLYRLRWGRRKRFNSSAGQKKGEHGNQVKQSVIRKKKEARLWKGTEGSSPSS